MTTKPNSNPKKATKICPRCKEEKKLTPAVFKYKQGRACYCRPCYNRYMKGAGCRKDKPDRRLTTLTDEQKRLRRNEYNKNIMMKKRKICQDYIRTLLLKSKCMDCGYSNWLALDFDHREPDKKIDGIGKLVYQGRMKPLLIEIPKCDVVCANCHRIRTANMFGSWRVTMKN